MEYCEVCGKECGESLHSRGPVKVYHWYCINEYMKDSREKVKKFKRDTVEAQKENSFWHSLPSGGIPRT